LIDGLRTSCPSLVNTEVETRMSKPKPIIVAVDDGYEFVKVLALDKQLCVPTAVSLSPRNGVQLTTAACLLDERHYQIEGVIYAVGADVREPIETRYDGFPFSPPNLAVAIDALRQVLPPGTPTHVVTGLPLDRFYTSSGEQREAIATLKMKAWSRDIHARDGSAPLEIVEVTVTSQCVAAWFDYVINSDLKPDPVRVNEHMIVVDIGGRTTDVAVFEAGQFDSQRSVTLDYGALDLAAVAARAVKDRFPGTPRPSHKVISAAVRCGTIRMEGMEIDLRSALAQERRRLVLRIIVHLEGLYRRSSTPIQRLLFVGGGSMLLQAELREHFPKAAFAEHAQMANARGMWKFGHMSEQMTEGQPTATKNTEDLRATPPRPAFLR
jgi:plasmid segregation protein ParM